MHSDNFADISLFNSITSINNGSAYATNGNFQNQPCVWQIEPGENGNMVKATPLDKYGNPLSNPMNEQIFDENYLYDGVTSLRPSQGDGRVELHKGNNRYAVGRWRELDERNDQEVAAWANRQSINQQKNQLRFQPGDYRRSWKSRRGIVGGVARGSDQLNNFISAHPYLASTISVLLNSGLSTADILTGRIGFINIAQAGLDAASLAALASAYLAGRGGRRVQGRRG